MIFGWIITTYSLQLGPHNEKNDSAFDTYNKRNEANASTKLEFHNEQNDEGKYISKGMELKE